MPRLRRPVRPYADARAAAAGMREPIHMPLPRLSVKLSRRCPGTDAARALDAETATRREYIGHEPMRGHL